MTSHVMSHDQLLISLSPSPPPPPLRSCNAPPALSHLSPYRDDGKDGLKFYTDPNYFFELWVKDQTKQIEKRQKKVHFETGNHLHLPLSHTHTHTHIHIHAHTHTHTHTHTYTYTHTHTTHTHTTRTQHTHTHTHTHRKLKVAVRRKRARRRKSKLSRRSNMQGSTENFKSIPP